jgi:hypothetical protein
MFTFNLHILVCRLGRQVMERGSSAHELEFAVEREVQVFKNAMGRRVCRLPERTFANHVLLDMRLRHMRFEHPWLKTMQQHCQATAGVVKGPAYDNALPASKEGDVSHASALLIGKGKGLHGTERTQAFDIAQRYLRSQGFKVPGWSDGDIAECEGIDRSDKRYSHLVLQFHRAECNEDYIAAFGHGAGEGTRVNHFIQTSYESNSGIKSYVAVVKHFIRVQHPSNDQAEPLRLAVCDVFGYLEPNGRLLRVTKTRVEWKNYPVAAGNIECKLVAFLPPDDPMSYFVRPLSMTTRV